MKRRTPWILVLSLLLLSWSSSLTAAALPAAAEPDRGEAELFSAAEPTETAAGEDAALAEDPLMEEAAALKEPMCQEEPADTETTTATETPVNTEEAEAAAFVEETAASEEMTSSSAEMVPSYTVEVGPCQIGAGELVSYTTISPSFAGSAVPENYYPGELTVRLTGQIVVVEGGVLDIGTLSIDGPEIGPVITGTGQIVVKQGGQLRLTTATLSPQGQGPMILQETGGSVELVRTEAAPGVVQWASPLVNNLYDSPEDVWLETGTSLSGEMLPEFLEVPVQIEGKESYLDVLLSWDLSQYDGRTDGTLSLSGNFLDEKGQILPSLLPLTLTVHWYTPETLTVTEAEWKGSSVPTVELTVLDLPEQAEVWGEVSTDGGKTWERWEDEEQFFLVPVEPESWACVFVVSDDLTGLFRVAAEDPWAEEYTRWQSACFAMSPPEDSEDSEGNRGGSTTPLVPDRQPQASGNAQQGLTYAQREMETETLDEPVTATQPAESLAGHQEGPSVRQDNGQAPPAAGQFLLVVVGLVVCVGAAVLAAVVLRKKK